MMPGITELAQNVWGTTAVRIGSCADFGGITDEYRDPDYATVVGLVMANKNMNENDRNHHRGSDGDGNKNNTFGEIKNFFKKFF